MSNLVYSDFWDNDEPDDPMRRFDVHENGKNIGHATVKENPDGYVWISGIYVDPAHRGRGLGDALMRQVYKAYPGNEFRLRARPYKDKPMDTAALLSYYKKRGFEPYDKENRMIKTAADNNLKMRRHHLPVRERVEGIITDGEGNVLLQAREGYVEMPGGGIDRGESPKDALKREAMEEAGVKLKNIKKKSVIESWWFPGIKDTDWGKELWDKYRGSRTHFFTAEADGPLREPTSDEGDGWEGKKWMRKTEAVQEMKSNGNSYGMSDYRDEQKKLVQKTAFMEGYASKQASSWDDDWGYWTDRPVRYLSEYHSPSWDSWGEEEPSDEELKAYYTEALSRLVKDKNRQYRVSGFAKREPTFFNRDPEEYVVEDIPHNAKAAQIRRLSSILRGGGSIGYEVSPEDRDGLEELVQKTAFMDGYLNG